MGAKKASRASSRYSADREEVVALQDRALLEHYARWLTDMTGIRIRRRTFAADLADGTALCSIMKRVPDSGVTSYKDARKSPAHLRAFHARDNMVKFQDACRRLALPDSISTQDLEGGNMRKVLSTMVQLEELCDEEELEPVGAPEDDYESADDNISDEEEEEEEPEPAPAVAAEAPKERRTSSSSRPKSARRETSSKKRRSTRASKTQTSEDPIQAAIDRLKALCGCDRFLIRE